MSVSPHDRVAAICTTVASAVCCAPEPPRSVKFNSRRDNPMAEANGGYRFKLLIENSIGEEQFNTGIGQFLEFLEAYHADRLDAATAEALSQGRVVGRTILIAYDPEQGRLRVVDPISNATKEHEAAHQ